MRVSIHHRFDDLAPLWRRWEAEGALTVFQTLDFVRAWHECAGAPQGRALRLALVEDRGRPLMLFPMVLRPRYGMKVLEFAGGLLADYESPVLAPDSPELAPDGFRSLWNDLVAACGAQAAHLRQIPAHIPGPAGRTPNPLALLPCRQGEAAHAAVPNGLTAEAYVAATARKSVRQDSRRQRKRLAELGEVRCLVAETPDDAERITMVMIGHKRRRFAETGSFDLFSMPGHEDFYLSFARARCGPGASPRAHVSALAVGEDIVATHWGMVFRDRFSFLMPTYEAGSWRRFSTGRLLLEELMADAFAQGINVFDFTVGGESYKADWCNVSEPMLEAVTPVSWRGRGYGWLLAARRRAQAGRRSEAQGQGATP